MASGVPRTHPQFGTFVNVPHCGMCARVSVARWISGGIETCPNGQPVLSLHGLGRVRGGSDRLGWSCGRPGHPRGRRPDASLRCKAEHHTEPVRDQPPRHAEDRPQRQADTPEQMRMSLKATSARKADDSRKWKPAKGMITPRRPGVVPSSAPKTAAMRVHRASSCNHRAPSRRCTRALRQDDARAGESARAAADPVNRSAA